MNLPPVLHNILNERYTTANLEKKKQDIQPLSARVPLSQDLSKVSFDPDIQRGQYNIMDPDLPGTEPPEEDTYFRPIWVPPPGFQSRKVLTPPSEPPSAPPTPPSDKPPTPPSDRSRFRQRFTERGVSERIPEKELERVVGRGPENPDVLQKIGPRGGFLGPVSNSEPLEAIGPDGRIQRLVRPRLEPEKELLRTFKITGQALPGAFIGSELADTAVDYYGLPLLPQEWEKENLSSWEPSSRTAYQFVGSDLGAAAGYGAIRTAGALGAGAAPMTALGIGGAATTSMLASPIGLAITAAPAIYTSARYLMTPQSDEINAIYKEQKRREDTQKIEQAREKQRQALIDDLYRRQQEQKLKK